MGGEILGDEGSEKGGGYWLAWEMEEKIQRMKLVYSHCFKPFIDDLFEHLNEN